MQIPEIECTRTFLNDNWFIDPKNSTEFTASHETISETPESLFAQLNIDDNEFIASMPSIPNIVNCAEDLLPVMSAIWGFPSYKGQQADAITSIINGKDCFINIPTGGGKSLLYMLPAISQPGITIVILPILPSFVIRWNAVKNNKFQLRHFMEDYQRHINSSYSMI